MTKKQAWIIIGLLVVIVALWIIRSTNDNKMALNRASSCFYKCQTTYFNSNGSETLNADAACKTSCYTDEGLTAPDFYIFSKK